MTKSLKSILELIKKKKKKLKIVCQGLKSSSGLCSPGELLGTQVVHIPVLSYQSFPLPGKEPLVVPFVIILGFFNSYPTIECI